MAAQNNPEDIFMCEDKFPLTVTGSEEFCPISQEFYPSK
jgi:hypothetical protein